MNERIRELAEQAYEQKPLMVVNPQTYLPEHKIGNGGVPMYIREFNQEKFAELIVRECADIAYKFDEPKLSGPGMIIGNRITENFGV
jgi:hypothetical protein